jgi:hypothetical protein
MAQIPATQPIRWKERIGIMAIGHTFNSIEVFLFDYVMYPAALVSLGTFVGFVVMTIASILLCYLHIRFYDWAKQDWLGLELLKEVRDGGEFGSRLGRFVQRIARKSDVAAFLSLSMYTDPFITTVYMRKGVGSYNGMTVRDWRIFWGSALVANLWWTATVVTVIEGAKAILSSFF